MRKDIEMDINNGDISARKRPPAYSSNLEWVDEDDFYIYGECVLERHLTFNNLVVGIGLYVGRADTTKEVLIKFSTISSHGEKVETGYLPVKSLTGEVMIGSRLPLISDDLFFRIYKSSGDTYFTISSGYHMDLNIEESMNQNEYFLLISSQSSLYKSPLTGIGVQRYLNGDIASSDLPIKIQSEFALDKMTVSKVEYDNQTGEIIIQSKEN